MGGGDGATDVWVQATSVAPADLVDATHELHQAVRIVASAGEAFADPRKDDRHRAMTWDPDQRALVGAVFSWGYPFRVAVRLESLTLVLLDRTGQALGSLPLAGHTLRGVYDWLNLGLATYMGPGHPTLEVPGSGAPADRMAVGRRFTGGSGPEWEALAALYRAAAELLDELTAGRDDASPVLCWPHDFALATRLTLAGGPVDAPLRTLHVGLAPGGGGHDTWHWYVSGAPPASVDEVGTPGAAGVGSAEGWVGAVLPGEALVARPDEARRRVIDFVETTTAACRRAFEGVDGVPPPPPRPPRPD